MSLLVELDQVRAALAAPGAQFEMIYQIIGGTTLKVYKKIPPNLTYFIVNAATYADRTFLVRRGHRLTFAEAVSRAAGLAEILRAHYGIAKGKKRKIEIKPKI